MTKSLETGVDAEFFARKSTIVAQELLGRYVLREGMSARIMQTAAYEAGNMTPARKGMLYAPGTIFLMPFRGHTSFNIATDAMGKPSCVEIRAAEIVHPGGKIEVVETPYKLARSLQLDLKGRSRKNLDGQLIGDALRITGQQADQQQKVTRNQGSDNCVEIYKIE